jgi:hypothetical protein
MEAQPSLTVSVWNGKLKVCCLPHSLFTKSIGRTLCFTVNGTIYASIFLLGSLWQDLLKSYIEPKGSVYEESFKNVSSSVYIKAVNELHRQWCPSWQE